MNYLEELCDYLEERGAIDHNQVLNVYQSLMPSLVPREHPEKESPWEEAARRWGIDVPDKVRGRRGGGGRGANRKAIKAPDLDALLPDIVLHDAQLSAFFPMVANGRVPKERPVWESWSSAVASLYALDDAALTIRLEKLLSGNSFIWRMALIDLLQFYARQEFFPSETLRGYSGPSVSAFKTEMTDYTVVSFTINNYNWLYVNARIKCLRHALIVRNRLRMALTAWLRQHADAKEVTSVEQLIVSDHGFLVNYVRNHRKEAKEFFQRWMKEHVHPEALCDLIEEGGFDPNYVDEDGSNILFWCNDELVPRLVALGVNPLQKNNNSEKAFDNAISKNEGVRFLAMLESAAISKLFYYNNKPEIPLLYKAAWWGCGNAVKLLLKDPQQVKYVNWQRIGSGETPLYHAAAMEHEDGVRALLLHGADAKLADNFGVTPLHRAAMNTTNPKIFSLLLEYGADPNAVPTRLDTISSDAVPLGYTPVMLLIEKFKEKVKRQNPFIDSGPLYERCLAILQLLVQYGMRADLVLRDNTPLLHKAAEFLPRHALKLLLEAGADPNQLDEQGRNALLHAAGGYLVNEVFDELIAAGANVNIQDKIDGDTPLIFLCKNNYSEFSVFERLIQAGADIHQSNDKGITPLHTLCKAYYCSCRSDKITMLLDAGAEIDVQDDYGNTPLHYIVQEFKEYKDLKWFVSTGNPNLELTNIQGKTPLHLAASLVDKNRKDCYAIEMVQCLLDAGAMVNVQDNDGNTPLHCAAMSNFHETYRALLNAGADTDIQNLKGETPAYLMKKNDR